jgi:hypothetical protein
MMDACARTVPSGSQKARVHRARSSTDRVTRERTGRTSELPCRCRLAPGGEEMQSMTQMPNKQMGTDRPYLLRSESTDVLVNFAHDKSSNLLP